MKDLEQLKENLEILQSITLLEYRNKNYLSGDNKTRNEAKQKLIEQSVQLIKKLLANQTE